MMKIRQARTTSLRAPFTIGDQSFTLYSKYFTKNTKTAYIIRYLPVPEAAEHISKYFFVTKPDPKASAVLLSVKTENLQKGIDILNSFINELNAADIEDRIKLSASTV